MKRKNIRSLTTAFLSLFLVCIWLATALAFPVSAAAAGSYSSSVNINNSTTIGITNTKTTIQIINTNNYLLKEAKKENKVLKKVKSDGKDWVNDSFALANAIKNSSDDTDWEKIGVEATKELITAIAGIWGFDGIAGAVLDGIESLTSSGQAPLSEVQVLSDDIDKRFNAISDQLYDIEEELGALSNQVTSTANDVLSGTQTQINNLEAKQILRSFMSSGEGNFSYLEYSNYLYGSDSTYVNASEAYYILLLEAIASGADDEQIEYYYNKLFDSLYSNIHIYNQYYYGDIAGLDKSMAAYYYDYLSYNPNLVDDGTSAEYQALLFALDLYTTYVYSYEILEMCFAYQAADMYLEASLKDRKILGTDTYEYAEGKTIAYSTIQEALVSMQVNLVSAEEQIAKDIAYILGMKDSYIVVDDNGDVHSIGNYGESFGNLADGQTVYLNIVPDEICELFMLNADNFRYYVNGSEYTGAYKSIIPAYEVNNDIFTATVTYGNTQLYSIEFTKIDSINKNSQKTPICEFSGGSGTIDDPYLISNAVQFYMVWNDLNASYKLISDIVVTGIHSPIGTEKKPFNGSFDGNGYFISGLSVESLAYDSTNITMNPTTGMFGTIGRNGTVKNLTLKAMSVVSDYQKDAVKPENDNSYYCIGGIAGTNRGVISNCTIAENSSIFVSRSKQTQDSRIVSVYVGGITGNNSGVIEYCSVDGLSINATSYHYYYNESVSKNEHALYVGGIAAITNNTIQNCRVSENTNLSAYAKSIADSEDREKPILTVFVGGVIADDSAIQFISNAYSACNITKCKGEIYNDGKYWGEHRYSWDNVTLKQGEYYPTFFPLSDSVTVDEFELNFYSNDYWSIYNKNYAVKYVEVQIKYDRGLTVQELQEISLASSKELKAKLVEDETKANADAMVALNGKVLSSYTDTAFTPNKDNFDVSIELTNNICDINAKYLTEYFNKLLDEENEVKNIKFVNESGNVVDATVVGYYGFNTYHEYATAQSITVKVFFYVDDILMSDDVTLSIKGKELVKWEIEEFVDEPFAKGSNIESCLEAIFENEFKLIYTFSNGQIEEYTIKTANKDDVRFSNFSTNEAGVKELEIIHLKQPIFDRILTFKANIFVKCPHDDNDFEHISTVSATCAALGYEVWECQLCGETVNKNYKKGFHDYIISGGVEATCHEAGYTQEVSCSVCGEIFESSEWIQALPHNYVSSSESGYKANYLYPSTEYHYCINGDHYESHQYTVSEYVDENGTLVYLYSCFCGYENPVPDYNIKTKENGEKPVVVVTNGYVLNVGDEVVVYIQIINNPGFKGATFGIRYDNGLELISADESMIVPQQLKVRNEVYNGYNFLWAEGDGNKTTEDGYLLKLTFRYVDKAESEQHISVVYGMSNGSEGGFCTLDDGYHMFMTQSGTISVVDHLPGDVNNDDVVDIMDATYIAWSIVGKTDENGDKIQVNAKYADVNLDGKVDLLDVLAILQSISGRYGTSLLSSDYKLFFNLNGFICDDADESVMVEFYDENGNRTKWSENVDFAKYENLMKQLGYSFIGWYTRIDCTCTGSCTHVVKATDFISYDKYQGNQTLYARWEKNRIVFDINGCDSEQIDDILYGSKYEDNPIITLPELTWSYNVTCIAFGTEDNTKYTGRIYRTFIGWEDENGNIITQIDILQPGLGVVNLKAKWSESYVWDAPVFDVNGYEIRDWYLDVYYTDAITGSTSWEDFVSALKENNFFVYSKKIATKYTISYENTKGALNSNLSEYTIESPKIVLSDIIIDGYVFDGWYNGDSKITEIPKYSFGDIVLTARWTPIAYTITYENIKGASNPNRQHTYTIEDVVSFENLPDVEGYNFKGWYTSENGGTKVTSIEKGCIGNKVYYAQWTPIVYTITYENTKGVINPNTTTYTIEDVVILERLSDVEGYAFDGWYTESGTKVSSIALGSTGDKVYYAGWTQFGYSIKYHNVYDAQNPNPYTYMIETETFTIKDIQRTGYYFKGWYSNSNLTVPLDTTIETGSTGEINCYAKWEAINYTISYDLNGGTNNSKNPKTYTIESVTIIFADPTRTGYTFDGWYTDSEFKQSISEIKSGSHGDVELHAKWTPEVYDITYHLNGGTNNSVNPKSYTIRSATTVFVDPTRKGYTFGGWYTDSGFTQAITEIKSGSYGNIELYAKWTPTPYTITFDYAGGADDAGNKKYSTTYTIETKNDDINIKTPTRDGYEFAHWTDESGKEVTIILLNGCTGDKTYTAAWKGRNYNITYNLNGTNNSSEQDSGMCYTEVTWKNQVPEDNQENAKDNDRIIFGTTGTYLDIPQASYYKFDGWYTASKGGVRITDGDGKVVNATQFTTATTLYAHWSKTEKTASGATYTYVKTFEDLKNIANNTSGHYAIIADEISLSGEWTPISTFSGTINGLNHKISGMRIETWASTTNDLVVGFVRYNNGTIIDLVFDDAKISTSKTNEQHHQVSMGIVCGENNGKIENVKVYNSSTYIKLGSTDYSKNCYAWVGVVTGINYGTINNCHVDTSTALGDTHTKKENADSYVGAIAGWSRSGSTISNCTVNNCSQIKAVCYGASSSNIFSGYWSAQLDAYAGGIVGKAEGATLSNCTVTGNTVNNVKAEVHNAASDCQRSGKGSTYGSKDESTTVTNCS